MPARALDPAGPSGPGRARPGPAAPGVGEPAGCLGGLARQGSGGVVIEHHTGLLEICDRLVELGPEGGEAGGELPALSSATKTARTL